MDLRGADELEGLPAGLHGYYATQIRAWQKDPAWHEHLLPLLATLAVAGESLPADVLGHLAGGVDHRTVRRLCDFTFRPLLTAERTGPDAPLRYEIYHASFRQVLKAGEGGKLVSAGAALPDELEALTDDLRDATALAHHRIADIYLNAFGGLDSGLPALAADPTAASADDGYPLRHLARHLHHAGQTDDLHQLLATSKPLVNGRDASVWFAAHDTAACLVSYLDDLARARGIAAIANDKAMSQGLFAPALGTEIRYALMTASIASRAAHISPELLSQLVSEGIWSPDRGLDHARRLADPASRCHALMAVHPKVSTACRVTIIAEALDAASAISDSTDQAFALASLAPALPADQGAATLAGAVDAANAVSDSTDRAFVLASLAPHLPADQGAAALASALHAANAISGDYRPVVLARLSAYLPPEQGREVLAAAAETATVIAGERLRDIQALDAADSTTPAYATSREYDVMRLTPLLPCLPSDRQREILATVLNTAAADNVLADLRATPSGTTATLFTVITTDVENARAKNLASIGPYLSADMIDLALTAATSISDDDARAAALTGLAPHLPPDQQGVGLGRALAAAEAICEDHPRAEALASLAPYLPPELLDQALTAAAGITSSRVRAWVLAALARHLPPGLRRAVLAEALAAATSITTHDARTAALTKLALHLRPAEQQEVLTQAANADITQASWEPLSALARHLPTDQRYAVLAQALHAALASGHWSSMAVKDLAPQMPPDLLSQAHAAVMTMSPRTHGLEVASGLAPYLPLDLLDQTLTAATAITAEDDRARALVKLAPHLPAGLLDQALAAATAITTPENRAEALVGLVPHLPPDQRPAVLDQALTATVAATTDFGCGRALADLAPLLPPALLTTALDVAEGIATDDDRARALTELARYMPPDQRPAALEQAQSAAMAIANHEERATALTELALVLPQHCRQMILAAALAAATATTESPPTGVIPSNARAHALRLLAPHLQSEQLEHALAAASIIDRESDRAEAISGLAPHLTPELLEHAFAIVAAIGDDEAREFALADMAAVLPLHLLSDAIGACSQKDPFVLTAILDRAFVLTSPNTRSDWMNLQRAALRESDRNTCLSIIASTTSAMVEIGGENILRACVEAIIDTDNWWP